MTEASRLYRFSIGTPPNLHIYTCCTPPMQRTAWTGPIHQRHTPKFICVAARRCKETSQLYRFTIGTPRNLHVLLLTNVKKRLDCTDSPQAHRQNFIRCCSPMQRNVSTVLIQHRALREINMCCCSPMRRNVLTVPIQDRAYREIDMCPWSPMQRNVLIVPIHHEHTATFTCVAAHQCKRNIWTVPIHHRHTAKFNCVAARAPMQRNVSTVPIHHRHTAKFTCVAARRCKETSRLYRFTIGTPRNLHVLLLTAQRNVSLPSHHRHTAKISYVAAHRCKETSRLYGLT